MEYEHLIRWGKHAFDNGISIEDIENQLKRQGMNNDQALGALHEITSFEHKVHEEVEDIKKVLISLPILILLIFAGVLMLYFAGIVGPK